MLEYQPNYLGGMDERVPCARLQGRKRSTARRCLGDTRSMCREWAGGMGGSLHGGMSLCTSCPPCSWRLTSNLASPGNPHARMSTVTPFHG